MHSDLPPHSDDIGWFSIYDEKTEESNHPPPSGGQMGRERPRGWGSFGGEKRWRNTRKFKDKDCTFPDQTCHTSSRPVTHNPSFTPSPGREPPLPMRRRLMASRMVWCWNRARHARATHCGHQETPDWKSPFPLSLNTPHELLCLFISPSHLPTRRGATPADRARSRLSKRKD